MRGLARFKLGHSPSLRVRRVWELLDLSFCHTRPKFDDFYPAMRGHSTAPDMAHMEYAQPVLTLGDDTTYIRTLFVIYLRVRDPVN